jgi:UPF0271 protein
MIEEVPFLKEILDASSIINSRAIPPGIHFITSPGVVKELKDKWSHFRIVSLLESGKITVIHPEEKYFQEISLNAQEIGSNLSNVDIEVLALGLQYEDGVIVTDDLEMQNVARFLNIKYRAATKHLISVQLRWIAICPGCNRQFTNLKRLNNMICEFCGTKLKKRARKIG